MDRWIDGWMDGRRDGRMEPFILIRHFIKLTYTAILKFGLHKIRKINITIYKLHINY